MIRVALVLLAALAAVVQIGAVPPAFHDRLGSPVLPVALIAAWAVMRDPREVWPALLVAGVLLGVVSEARVGSYVLALLPAVAAGMVLAAAGDRRDRAAASGPRRLAAASVSGAVGAVAYVAVLALSGGTWAALPREAGAIGAILLGAAWTGTMAIAIAAALWPLRQRGAGLFA